MAGNDSPAGDDGRSRQETAQGRPANLSPRYPIYVPSKGRYLPKHNYTARFLIEDRVPFHLVVEPQEADHYAAAFGVERVLVLPFRDRGSVVPARNWIKDHAIAAGHERHWQLDDNIKWIDRRYKGRRLRVNSGAALRIVEDFCDRYENIAVAGLQYSMFAPDGQKFPPYVLNCHVYSCTLIFNSIPHRWRGVRNEDTDLCLQVLADGWCTVLVHAFLAKKLWTMLVPGGNTAELYQGDGRLRMARELQRRWPGVVTTKRRFQRPQHVVADSWRKFDTPLKLKPGLRLEDLPAVDERGLELVQVAPEIKSPRIQKLYDEAHGS